MKLKLKSLEVISEANKSRISSVDIFRAAAILAVVVYHFNKWLPFGYIGVDLFFVISGLLVGGLLTKEFAEGRRINYFRFILQRGFKIWASYYVFIIAGNSLAFLFYHHSNSEQIIPLWDMKRYLFFYQNYTGLPFHWSFDGVWSLCVEEHFYIMLPIMFLIVQNFIPGKYKIKSLFIFTSLTILSGIFFKLFSFYFTHGQDTYSATHNRIDALAWGVLLNLIISYYGERIKSKMLRVYACSTGAILFIMAIYCTKYFMFYKLILHSFLPASFFMLMLGLYYTDFSKLKPLRIIAYYSYNWYLWHPVFSIFIIKYFGNTFSGFTVYLIVTFFIAVIATIFIEEPVMAKRKTAIEKLFGRQSIKKRPLG